MHNVHQSMERVYVHQVSLVKNVKKHVRKEPTDKIVVYVAIVKMALNAMLKRDSASVHQDGMV